MKFHLPPILACLVILSGCATGLPHLDHSFSPEIPIEGDEQFALLPNPHPEWDSGARAILGRGDVSFVALEAMLESRGIRKAEDTASVELLVGLRAEVIVPQIPGNNNLADKIVPIRRNTSMDRVQLLGSKTGESGAVEGLPSHDITENELETSYKLHVEVFDADSGARIWHGEAIGTSLSTFSTDAKRLRIIEALLARFPN